MILNPITFFIFEEKDGFAGFGYHYLVVVQEYHFKGTICDLL
jgi:hypothetical protein